MYIKHLAGTKTEILLFLLSFVNFSVKTTSFWYLPYRFAGRSCLPVTDNGQTLKFSNKKCYQYLAWRLLLHSGVEKPFKCIGCLYFIVAIE